MKGQMKVKKLNDTGLYISEMDWKNMSRRGSLLWNINREPLIRYVLFILKNNKKKINNIKQYLLTVLFNAPATCCSFFQNQTFDK